MQIIQENKIPNFHLKICMFSITYRKIQYITSSNTAFIHIETNFRNNFTNFHLSLQETCTKYQNLLSNIMHISNGSIFRVKKKKKFWMFVLCICLIKLNLLLLCIFFLCISFYSFLIFHLNFEWFIFSINYIYFYCNYCEG